MGKFKYLIELYYQNICCNIEINIHKNINFATFIICVVKICTKELSNLPTNFKVFFRGREKGREGISKVSRKLCNQNICRIETLRKNSNQKFNQSIISKFILRLVKNSRHQQTQEKKSQS